MPDDLNVKLPIVQAVLFYNEPPSLDGLGAFVTLRLPDARVVSTPDRDSVRFHVGGEVLQSQLWFVPGELPPQQSVQRALAQTFNWPGAAKALSSASSTLVVSDFFSGHLTPQERCRRLVGAIAAMHETSPCEAIWVPSAELILDPEHLLDHAPLGMPGHPLLGLINVRVFHLDGAPQGEQLMDTRGLSALGLPDLQCHFVGLDLAAVADLLFHGAIATFEGNVDPLALDGWPAPGWSGRMEDSMAPPPRRVLDLCPPADSRGSRGA